MYSYVGPKMLTKEYLPELLLQILYFNIVIFTLSSSFNHHSEFVGQMVKFLESQDIFKRILNNFKEPLLILGNSKAEFVNKTFFETFND